MRRRQDDIEQKVIFAAQERTLIYDRQTKMESQVEEMKPAAIGNEGMNLTLYTNCLQHYTLVSPFV